MSVGAIVGSAIGFAIGGPTGARIGYTIGSAVDPGDQGKIEGPRLSDRSVALAQYGAPVIEAYGPTRVTAQVLWSAPLREVRTEEEQGKGGGPTQVSYSYYWSAVLSLAWAAPEVAPEGYVLHRLWINKKLVADYTQGIGETAPVADLERRISSDVALNVVYGIFEKNGNRPAPGGWITFHPGGANQLPPTVQQETEGVDNTPGYMHHARLDIRDLPLTEDVGYGPLGNRPPVIEAEISIRGLAAGPSPLRLIFSTEDVPVSADWLAVGPTLGAEPRWAMFPPVETPESYTLMSGDRAIRSEPWGITGSAMPYKGPPRERPFGQPLYAFERRLVADTQKGVYYQIPNSNNGTGEVAVAGQYTLMTRFAAGGSVWLYGPGSGGAILSVGPGYEVPEGFVIALQPIANALPPTFAYIIAADVDEHCSYVLYKRTLLTGLWLYRKPHPGVQPAGYAEELDIEIGAGSLLEANSAASSGFESRVEISVRNGVLYVMGEKTGALGLDRLLRCALAGGERVLTAMGDFTGFPGPSWADGQFYCDDSLLLTYSRNGFAAATVYALPSSGTTVGAVANALMRRASLEAEDIDVSDTNGIPLFSYAQARRTPARGGVEQLSTYAPAQVFESGGRVRMQARRATDPVFVIDEDLLLEPVEVSRTQDKDLPREITVTYASVESNQQPGAQSASWKTGIATAQQNLDLAMSMPDARAASLARFSLVDAYVARIAYKFSTPMHLANIEPGDVVQIPGHGRARISVREEGQGRMNFEAVAEDPLVYEQLASGVGSSVPSPIVGFAGPSDLLIMDDVPPLRDADTEPMAYVGFGATGGGWRGAYLTEGGVLVEGAVVQQGAQRGRLLTALPASAGGVLDIVNTVDIELATGQLANITSEQAYAGAQMLNIGSELVGVQYAELIGSGQYRCRGLIRGMRGSSISAHAAGARAIRITVGTVRPYTFEAADIGSGVELSAVSIGQSPTAAAAIGYTIPAGTSRLLSPVHVRAGRLAGGALEIRWTRRGRFDQTLRDNGETRLDDTEERYEVDILNGANVVRTIATNTQSATYTAAEQVADFGSSRTSLSVRVYQLSNISGRGRPAAATLTIPA